MSYFALLPDWDETHVYVDEIPSKLKKKYQLLKGVSRLDDWPDDVVFKFSANRPEGMVLTDWIDNAFSLLVVSNRFKAAVEGCGPVDIEYLPVAIADHRGELVDGEYWILNSLILPPVMDRERSVSKPHGADENRVSKIDKLVLTEDFLASAPPVVRPSEYPRVVLLRDDLAATLQAEGVTGVRFRDSDQFKTHDPDD